MVKRVDNDNSVALAFLMFVVGWGISRDVGTTT
jgi:hypothetical protein